MSRKAKKLTNMVWRSMGESILLTVVFAVAIIYFLQLNDYISPIESWSTSVQHALLLIVVTMIVGGSFGFWQSHRVKRRLGILHDSLLYLEKGNLSRTIPDLGEDEVGRLGDQLNKVSRKWEEQVTSLQRLSSDNVQLTEKVRFSAVTEERQRLARDLHDAVSQQLFAISMTATALGRTMERDFEKAKQQVSLIEEMASVAQSEMRALLLHLRPIHLEGKRLSQGLNDLLLELKAKVPIEISLVMNEEIALNKGIEDHLFRIVQEALSNTLRHSKASHLEISLLVNDELIRLSIRDNGIGFELDQQRLTSYGLVSMKERVNEIGGDMNIITAPGKGTKINIRVPNIIREEDGPIGLERTDAD